MVEISRKLLFMSFCATTLVFGNCRNGEPIPMDRLEEIGILGKWELQSITIDGITDLSVPNGTVEFLADGNANDRIGEFISQRDGIEDFGWFELDTATDSIFFSNRNNNIRSFLYSLKGSSLTLKYSERGSVIEEGWVREHE